MEHEVLLVFLVQLLLSAVVKLEELRDKVGVTYKIVIEMFTHLLDCSMVTRGNIATIGSQEFGQCELDSLNIGLDTLLPS